jgi:rRNA-processing protein FCF1
MAPDVLIAELQELGGDLLVDYGLTRIELSGDEVQEVYRLAILHRGPSVNDLFALVAAKTMGALLLTGDRHLREAAEQEGVPVHGTLWLLDEILRLAVIPPLVAAQALGSGNQ